jgi:hypothetical protein
VVAAEDEKIFAADRTTPWHFVRLPAHLNTRQCRALTAPHRQIRTLSPTNGRKALRVVPQASRLLAGDVELGLNLVPFRTASFFSGLIENLLRPMLSL